MITPYPHQEHVAQFKASTPRCFDHSDPGTGKTISSILGFLRSPGRERMLVVAPLSILKVSWGDDIAKASDLSYAIAHGNEAARTKAFASGAKVVIINHDGVKWLAKNLHLLAGFTHVTVDEYTAFKNRTTQRGKALLQIAARVPYLWMLSGTPDSNGLCDMWFPALLVDNGQRLGRDFWRYRSNVCVARQVGPRAEHVQWVDRPEAIMEVADKLKDISIRYKLTECIDMPENIVRDLFVPMPKEIEKLVKQFKEDAYLELESGVVNAVQASSRTQKLLQILSGSVYGEDGEKHHVHNYRHELITELVMERAQCLVAFNWRHEREGLVREAERNSLLYAVIDGDTPVKERERIVNDFQRGAIKVIYAHPQSAGHGLTLTAGTTTIWASPTANAEHYIQFNARIYRNGQTQRTETIRVGYENSAEIAVYNNCDGKVTNMTEMLQLMVDFRSPT